MPTKNFRHVRKTAVVKTPDGGQIKLGSYRPDKKNRNDKTFKPSQFSAADLPPKVDLRPYMTSVENQGNSNSCTANAMAGAYEYLAKRVKGSAHDVSRLFIYYNARELDGATDADEGTYLRSCVKVLKKYGTCAEATWPFDLHRIFEPPHENAYTEATNFLIEDAYRVEVDLTAMRSCLAEGYPFSFGLSLFSSFQNAGSNGLVPMPDPENEQHDGGHAMLCVGYSDADKVFIVRNSWGDGWGDRGYCYIPYDYMTNPELNGDLWSIRHVTDADIDLSQNVQGSSTSLFDGATAAIATAIQVPGVGSTAEYSSGYNVEYTEEFVFVDGQFITVTDDFDFDTLYYAEYEEEYEEYTLLETSEEETTEYSYEETSETTEYSYEETSEETSETSEYSYEETSEEEESEESDEEESEDIEASDEDDEEESEDEEEESDEEESEDIEASDEDDEEESEDEEEESDEEESEDIEASDEDDEEESEDEEEESDEEESEDIEASDEDEDDEESEEDESEEDESEEDEESEEEDEESDETESSYDEEGADEESEAEESEDDGAEEYDEGGDEGGDDGGGEGEEE